jgi:hypothetical protein
MRFTSTLVFSFLFAATSFAECGDKVLGMRPVADLRPTQFAVGMREVDVKREELDLGAKALRKFLCENPIPVVLGPGGKAYIVDHHHLALALIYEKINEAAVNVVQDWSADASDLFWEKMQKSNYVYLRDEKGAEQDVSRLPTRLEDLRDDPYRSLAYFVRKDRGYKKVRTLFAEFQWAEFFRTRVDVGTTDRDFKAATAKAVKLARSKAAAALPGYKKLTNSQ